MIDIGEPGFTGYGLVFVHPSVWDLNHAIERAMGWYTEQPGILTAARQKMMQIDNSWETSATRYIEVYQK